MEKIYLKTRRKELGLTLKQVAEAVGVSESTVSRWESGNISNMRMPNVEAMANVLHASVLWIVGMDISKSHIEFQDSLEKEAKKYVDLSSNFFGEAKHAKDIINAEAKIINSLKDLTVEQYNEIYKYINYIKLKKEG